MCLYEIAARSVTSGASTFAAGVSRAGAAVASLPSSLNRSFVNLTNQFLPANVASFTQKAVYALPVTVAIQTLPGQVVVAAFCTYALASILLGLSDSTHSAIGTGLRNSYAFSAARSIVDLAQTANPESGYRAIVLIVLTAITDRINSSRAQNRQQNAAL